MPSFVRGNNNSNTSTSIATTFASNSPTNLLVAVIKTGISGNTTSISDTAGNSWTSAGLIDGANWRLQVWYAVNCVNFATTNTVTVTVASSAANILCVGEYTGVLVSSVFSAELSANGSGTALSSGSLTVVAGDLLIGAGFASAGGAAAGSGFTSRESGAGLMLEDKVSTSTSDTATMTGTTGSWSMIGVSFHQAIAQAANLDAPMTNAGQNTNHQIVKAGNFIGSAPSNPLPAPVGSVLKGGTTGSAYSETISAQGGTSPYTFAVTSGALPTGTTLNSSTGVISGTTSAAATFTFTITVTDANGFTGGQSFTIVVANPSSGGGYSYTYCA